MSKKLKLKYHHIGIPTDKPIKGEVYLEEYKVYHYGYEKSEYGIEWMRYEKDWNIVAFIEENGAPIEFIQIKRKNNNL